MKIKNFIFLSAIFILLASCSNELVEPEKSSTDHLQKSTRVDMKTALDRAEKMFAKIEGGKTRSRSVGNIQYLHVSSLTRSNGDFDSLYYLINYENNGGFAITGADTRLDEIYAIGEEGNLTESDMLENPGLQYFFDTLPDNDDLALMYGNQFPNDSTLILLPPINLGEDINISTKKGPYININVSKWDQEDPFNVECPIENGSRCYAGCVPVAAAILMSYHEWPHNYKDKAYDWNAIKNATVQNGQIISSNIPNLIRELGSKDNFKTEYHSSSPGSGSNMVSNHKRTFKNLGYREPNDFKDFKNADVMLLINNSESPVLMQGTGSSGCHAWVVDGYYNDVYVGNAFVGGGGGNGLLLHVIWGWGGRANGYFKFGGSVMPMKQFNETWDWQYSYDYWMDKIQFPSDIKYVGDFKPNK